MTVQHAVRALEADGYANASQKLVLIEIAYRADRKGVVRRSQSEIASDAALSRRTVAQWFAEFEASGILTREGHGRYRLSLHAFDESDDGTFADLIKPVARAKSKLGADEELARLKAIMTPSQGIYYDAEGWPALKELKT